ncbi:MAG: protein-L-isoaspartate(D-aspartate) O-methyltransferase [Planctomycetota bacterium]|jgi:protein-L-isoaspartate(D-aspartate) O-methyltransferase
MEHRCIKKQNKFLIIILISLITYAFLTRHKIENSVFASEGSTPDSNQPQNEPNKPSEKTARPDHSHPAFGEKVEARDALVSRYIVTEGIKDQKVIKAMRTVPRHSFVPKRDVMVAYADRPLYIGYGQTISQPYIVAYMTEALQLDPNDKVLEVGTGSGYQAAVCAEIVNRVYSIEIIEPLANSAKQLFKEIGYPNIFVRYADGYDGWPEEAPFDAIIVTCAAGFVPPPLIEQLKPGGKMIIPLNNPFGLQNLVLLRKDEQANVTSRQLLPVRFVPMTGRMQR